MIVMASPVVPSRRVAPFTAVLSAAGLVTVTVFAAPMYAQMPAVHATARFGLGMPSDDYQTACGYVSPAFSVDVQGSGRLFPHIALDHFAGAGGGDIACLAGDPSTTTARGGLQLDGATRLGVGAGARIGSNRAQLEALVSAGVVSGQNGFVPPGASSRGTIVPHVGGQLAVVANRHVVLSAAAHWTRLTLDVTSNGTGAVERRRSWSPMVTMQIGARIPLVRRQAVIAP